MSRVPLWLAAALFVAGLLLAAVVFRSGTVREMPPAPEVAPAALAALLDTKLPDVAGKEQALSQWRGKILVVNYWATWCIPCRDEMPMFSKLSERYAAKGVQFVGIAADEKAKVVEHAREKPVVYPLLVGEPEAIKPTRDFGNGPLAVPFTVVLDREGKVRTAVLGRVHEDALVKFLDALM